MHMYFVAKISLKYLIKYNNKNNIIFEREVSMCACDEYLYVTILNLFSQNQSSLCIIFPY